MSDDLINGAADCPIGSPEWCLWAAARITELVKDVQGLENTLEGTIHQHAQEVAELVKERNEAQDRCRRIGPADEDQWVDEHETVWVRPTAWAYAAACKAGAKHRGDLQAAEARISALLRAIKPFADAWIAYDIAAWAKSHAALECFRRAEIAYSSDLDGASANGGE